MPQYTDTNVNQLVINKMTKAQYESITPSDTELYLIPDEVDTTPTSNSDNPITSGGVYTALQNKADKVSNATSGDFAGLNSSGNLTDSGYSASDFIASNQGSANAGKSLVIGNDGTVSPDIAPISKLSVSIPFGQVDSTSTSTVFTATVENITELRDGICCYLRNDVVNSAAGYTININNLGAKSVYSSLNNGLTETVFKSNSTYLFVYNSTRISGGCWDLYAGYNSDTTYNLNTNYTSVGYVDVGAYPLVSHSLCAFDINNKLTPFVTTATLSTGKTLVDSVFPIGAKIYKSNYSLSANRNYNDRSAICTTATSCDLRYSSVYHSSSIFPNDTFNKIFMPVNVNLQNETFTLKTQETSDITNNFTNHRSLVSGNFYIEIGFNSSYSTSYYFALIQDNKLFYYDGNKLIEYPVYRVLNVSVPVTDVTVGGTSVVSNGVAAIPSISDEVVANPTVPSGTSTTDLTGLQVGNDYYKIQQSNWSQSNSSSASFIKNKPTIKSGSGINSVIINNSSTSQGDNSLSHGGYTSSVGENSHSEGYYTTALNEGSHAEGRYTTTNGRYSHAEGSFTITNNDNEHAEGYYNYSQTDTLFSIGVGTNDNNRRNLITVNRNKLYITNVGSYGGTSVTESSKPLDYVLNMPDLQDQDYNYIFNGGTLPPKQHPLVIPTADLSRYKIYLDRNNSLMYNIAKLNEYDNIQDYMHDFFEDPDSIEQSFADKYQYYDDIVFDDNACQLWYCPGSDCYGVLKSDSVQTMINNSKETNLDNEYTPFIAMLFNDMSVIYTEEDLSNISTFYKKSLLCVRPISDPDPTDITAYYLYIGDYGDESGFLRHAINWGYNNINDYVYDLLEIPERFGAESYRFNSRIEIDGDDNMYELWLPTDENVELYMILKNDAPLYMAQHSVEADYHNKYCPFIAAWSDYEETLYDDTLTNMGERYRLLCFRRI